MPNFLRLLIFLLAVAGNAGADTAHDGLIGYWQGAFVRDGSVQIVEVEISHSADGWRGVYAIPELAIYEQPVRELFISDTLVVMRFNYGQFDLVPDVESAQMTGINPKWGPPVRLHLKKQPDGPIRHCVQREFVVRNNDETLHGTLYLPIGNGPFPVVVVAHGGGDSTRSEWVYRSHAYALTKQGVAAFIYDKPGYGESVGNREATLFDLARGVNSIMEVLRSEQDIDSRRVGILGVSRGGWVATIAASTYKNANFVALLQGPALSVEQQDFDGISRTMRANDFPTTQIDSALVQAQLYFELVNRRISFAEYQQRSYPDSAIGWVDYGRFAKSDEDVDWWRANAYDPAKDLSTIACPVVAIFGEIDTYVSPESNLELMKSLVTKSGQPFKSVIISNLGHAVATYQKLAGGKWDWPNGYWVWSKRPPELDSTLAEWIRSLR